MTFPIIALLQTLQLSDFPTLFVGLSGNFSSLSSPANSDGSGGWQWWCVAPFVVTGTITAILIVLASRHPRPPSRPPAPPRTPPNLDLDLSAMPSFAAPADRASDACTICFDALSDATVSPAGACAHLLHTACLRSWLQKDATCPVCRGQFVSDLESGGEEDGGARLDESVV